MKYLSDEDEQYVAEDFEGPPRPVPLPCPFCGGAAKIFTREVHDTPEPRRTLYWYVCNTHGCGVGLTHGEWSERAALDKWNKRSSNS